MSFILFKNTDIIAFMITEQSKYDSMLQEMAIPFNQFHGITISMYDAVMKMKTYENDIRSTGNAKYNSQWRQMEIPAWYNEFIMNNYCNASMHIKRSEIPFQTGDNSEMLFDYEYDGIVFDIKTHGVNDNVMILNDMNAIDACIVKQGSLFLFVITEQYAMDDDGSFKIWHDKLKGKPSKYVSSNKNRRTRMRKKSAIIERMDLFEINYHNASMLKIMKQPHNSNGKPRPMKYMLDDRLIQPVSSIIW